MMVTPVYLHLCKFHFNAAVKHDDAKIALELDPEAKLVIEIPMKLVPSKVPPAPGVPKESLGFDMSAAKVHVRTSGLIVESGVGYMMASMDMVQVRTPEPEPSPESHHSESPELKDYPEMFDLDELLR